MRSGIAEPAYDLQCQLYSGYVASPGMVHPSAAACCGLSVATSGSLVAADRKFGAFCEGLGFSIQGETVVQFDGTVLFDKTLCDDLLNRGGMPVSWQLAAANKVINKSGECKTAVPSEVPVHRAD
jgi:hypothetical protein